MRLMSVSSARMVSQIRPPACFQQLFRVYTTSSSLQIPKKEPLPDPHDSREQDHCIKKGTRRHRPLLKRPILRNLTFADENARNRAEIQRKALQISTTWSTADSLVEPVSRPRDHEESVGKNVTDMTTNFMIHVPYQIIHRTFEDPKLDKSQILQNLRVLLLKRDPHADPFPSGWTAVSGRLEADQSGTLESPIDGALREIKEETNQEPALFQLETALPPFTVQSPDSRIWRVWPILWCKQLPLDQHGFPLDETEGLLDPRTAQKITSLLDYSIKLNEENVEFGWKKWADIETLPGLVPGLAGSLERLVCRWIEEEDSRNI